MKYLIPFDFTSITENALKQAIQFAAHDGGEIYIVHIVDDAEHVYLKEIQLKEYMKSLSHPENVSISSHVSVGAVLTDIGKIADYHDADLVIMGTHGVDSFQKMFGSKAVKVIKNSSVPFILLQEGCGLTDLKKIVMPISIERKSIQVLKYAAKFSKLFNAEIHLVGRVHEDSFLKHKENTNVILINDFLHDNNIKHYFEIVNVSKSDFMDFILNYSEKIGANLIATTYFSDSLLPIFEKFVQNLIVNPKNIPVLCVNAQSLTKADATLSLMTS